jgi:hypothetical protein|tara:strand:+ start:6921 stop:7346 length:426 start_codon:yes stop_codon:yes gene_type:complete
MSANKIIRDHQKSVSELIKRLERKSRSEVELSNLDRLRKRISLLRNISESAVITEMGPTIKMYSEKIINREESFFMTTDARAEFIKINARSPTSQEEFIFDLISSVRTHYSKSSQKEKDDVYSEVLNIHNCCIEYELCMLE